MSSSFKLPQANQFDIIRSYSKDKFYRLKQLHLIKNIYLTLLTSRQNQFLLKYANEFEFISDICYYALTTGSNMQSIGQEYFNLIYFNKNTQRPLNKKVFALFFNFLIYLKSFKKSKQKKGSS